MTEKELLKQLPRVFNIGNSNLKKHVLMNLLKYYTLQHAVDNIMTFQPSDFLRYYDIDPRFIHYFRQGLLQVRDRSRPFKYLGLVVERFNPDATVTVRLKTMPVAS